MSTAAQRKRREEYQRNHASGAPFSHAVKHMVTPEPSDRSSEPCFKCGAREGCRHRVHAPAIQFVSPDVLGVRLQSALNDVGGPAMAEFDRHNRTLLQKVQAEALLPERYPREMA
jgi:hypothetical protein